MIAGVDATGARIDSVRQLLRVSRAQLGHAAIVEDHLRQFVQVGNRVESFLVGRGLTLRCFQLGRKLQLIEQDRLQLLGRIQAERMTGQAMCLRCEFHHALAQLLALQTQRGYINQDATLFHPRQHRHQWNLDGRIDVQQRRYRFQLCIQRVMQAQGDIGVFGGVTRGGFQIDLREGNLLRTLAAHFFVGNRLDTEIALRQRIHVMPRRGGIEHVGFQHRILRVAIHRDAILREEVDVVLAVLAKFGFGGVFEDGLDCCQNHVAIKLFRRAGIVVGQWHIGGVFRFESKRDADDLGQHRIESGRFNIERDQLRVAQLLQPRVEMRVRSDQLVVAIAK